MLTKSIGTTLFPFDMPSGFGLMQLAVAGFNKEPS
jgi:hypothetical protein